MSSLSGIENHLERCLDLEDHEILEYIESKQLDEELRKALLQRLGIVSEDEHALLKPSEVVKHAQQAARRYLRTLSFDAPSQPSFWKAAVKSVNQSRTPD